MSDTEPDPPRERITQWLDAEVRFQRRWRRLMMNAYVSTTVVTVVTSALAAILAALQYNKLAAASAAVTTVLLSIEKSLLFREKWKLHVTMVARLQSIQLGLETGQIEVPNAVERAQQIIEQYSTELPIMPRE